MTGPNFIAIDFEHCNHSYASICSVGAVRVENGVILNRWSRFIRPARGYNHISRSLLQRGFTVDINSVANGLGIREALRLIVKSIDLDNPATIVGHGIASADLPMLHQAWSSANPDHPGLPALPVVCTSQLAKARRPDLPNSRLNTVAAAVIPEFKLNHHDAASDAEACALIAMKLAPEGLEPWTTYALPSSRRAKMPTIGIGDLAMPARTEPIYGYHHESHDA